MVSCKRSELDEVATRAIFPDFDYALIAAIKHVQRHLGGNLRKTLH
jgi:hypothetical protein